MIEIMACMHTPSNRNYSLLLVRPIISPPLSLSLQHIDVRKKYKLDTILTDYKHVEVVYIHNEISYTCSVQVLYCMFQHGFIYRYCKSIFREG